MRVTAAEGLQVPYETEPRKHITHNPAEPVVVPDTSYYRRRVASGELTLVAEATEQPAPVADAAEASAKPAAKAKRGARA